MNKLNLETIVRRGYRTRLESGCFHFSGNRLLCALVGKRYLQKERGVRGSQVHWKWSAYKLTSLSTYRLIEDGVSTGLFDRVVFMFLDNKYYSMLDNTIDIQLQVSSSVDESESSSALIDKLKKGFINGSFNFAADTSETRNDSLNLDEGHR